MTSTTAGAIRCSGNTAVKRARAPAYRSPACSNYDLSYMDTSSDAGGETEAPTQPRTSSAPSSFQVSVRACASEKHGKALGSTVGEYVRELGKHFELKALDGVTVAYDYAAALRELDRGFTTSHVLQPSDGHAIGVAMTPSVMRDGVVKSRIVLNANLVDPILEPKDSGFQLALHIIAHECAHVEVTSRFDDAFPGVLLQRRYEDPRLAFRWQVITACWDEYAATNLSAGYGEDPSEGYESTFLKHLADVRKAGHNYIKQYRFHGDVDQVLAEVYGEYGTLLKFAAYFLGNLAGCGLELTDSPRAAVALDGHWFEPYFKQLQVAFERTAASYRTNTLHEAHFESIGDIVDDLVAQGGLVLTYLPTGQLHVSIPETPETVPSFLDTLGI